MVMDKFEYSEKFTSLLVDGSYKKMLKVRTLKTEKVVTNTKYKQVLFQSV